METSELERFRQVLLRKRAELVGDSDQLRREGSDGGAEGGGISHVPIHMADAASDAHDHDFALGRLSASSATVQDIDEALERIDAGTFGICEECGGEISGRRLAIRPHASLCIECKRKEETP